MSRNRREERSTRIEMLSVSGGRGGEESDDEIINVWMDVGKWKGRG